MSKLKALIGEEIEVTDPMQAPMLAPDKLGPLIRGINNLTQELRSQTAQQEANIERLARMTRELTQQISIMEPKPEPVSRRPVDPVSMSRHTTGEPIRIPHSDGGFVNERLRTPGNSRWESIPLTAPTPAPVVPRPPPAPPKTQWTLRELVEHCSQVRNDAVIIVETHAESLHIMEIRNEGAGDISMRTQGQDSIRFGLLKLLRFDGPIALVTSWNTHRNFRVLEAESGSRSITLRVC